MGTYHSFVTQLIDEDQAREFQATLRNAMSGYSHNILLVKSDPRYYLTGWVKDFSGDSYPLISASMGEDIGVTWVSDEGHYGSNKDNRGLINEILE